MLHLIVLFAAKWGITPGVKSRKRFAYVFESNTFPVKVLRALKSWTRVAPAAAQARVRDG